MILNGCGMARLERGVSPFPTFLLLGYVFPPAAGQIVDRLGPAQVSFSCIA